MLKSSYLATFFGLICFFFIGAEVFASAPKVGRKAAAKYFMEGQSPEAENEPSHSRKPNTVESLTPDERYLTFGVSNYMSSDSYSWGGVNEEKVGKWGIDMTYRISEFRSLFDEALRVSYTEYEPNGKRASKLSFLYTFLLPDASSKFPLYFGAGIGPGVFFRQVKDKSFVSLDYQLIMGARFFDIFNNAGFFIETGLKNHLLVTSSGQFNGVFLSAGAVFTF